MLLRCSTYFTLRSRFLAAYVLFLLLDFFIFERGFGARGVLPDAPDTAPKFWTSF